MCEFDNEKLKPHWVAHARSICNKLGVLENLWIIHTAFCNIIKIAAKETDTATHHLKHC